jgi:hypothetical protein
MIKKPVKVWGPTGDILHRFSIYTGSKYTLECDGPKLTFGYYPAMVEDRVQVTTGSNIEYAPFVVLERFQALEQERSNFRVLSHTLPPSANVDGLLGLDFMRGQRLEIDFRSGEISLA